jgi:hypothetical protein
MEGSFYCQRNLRIAALVAVVNPDKLRHLAIV